MAAGAFILNSGLNKLKAEKETHQRLHEMASGAYSVIDNLPPEQFGLGLGATEVALGSALLMPFVVSDGLAGLGLTSFASGLLGLYMKTPGMRQEGSVRPSSKGTALAKDSWLAGMGLTLMLSGTGNRRKNRVEMKAKRRKAEAKAAG